MYAIAGVAAGAVSYAFGQSQNLIVFRQAAHDLVAGADLYQKTGPDYFKYSPTFALLFVPFAALPAWIVAPLWSLLNFVVAFVGVDRAVKEDAPKRVALTLALGGILLATDGDQSNLLVTGMFLLAFALAERDRGGAAGQVTLVAAHVKLFPVFGGVFLLFRRDRWRLLPGFAIASAAWALLPLIVLSPSGLAMQYRSWFRLLGRDSDCPGWSVMHLASAVSGHDLGNRPVQIAGIVMVVATVALGLAFGTDREWRRRLACSLLVFSVLFNHRAEYATFVLSATAAGIWYATGPRTPARLVLVVLAAVAPGPFFARPDASVEGVLGFLAAHRLFHPLRIVPLLAIWCWMQVELVLRLRPLLAGERKASS
jgi:uncharacterized membrane protein